MHRKYRTNYLTIILCFLFAILTQGPARAALSDGIIAATRATDWSRPGVKGGIPNRTMVCATLNPGASASQINSAISSCPANQVVMLTAGTYNLSGGISFGTKSNVTLRGAGADKTLLNFSNGSGCAGLASVVCMEADGVNENSPPNSTSWTGGYARGSNVLTVGSTSGMKVGGILLLDQLNDGSDTGQIFVCSSTNCSDEGGNSPGRNNRGQQQLVKVLSISGNQVTIEAPIRMPNWRSSQSPGVFWNGGAPLITGNGVENLSLNITNANDTGGVVMVYVSDCWVKGIRSINADRSHVWFYKSMRNTVRDSYFYGTQNAASQSYGVEGYSTGDNLIENNIFQHVTAPIKHNGSDTGTVAGYNFSIDDNYTPSSNWMIPTVGYHEVGISYLLHEGNDGLGALHDGIHGTTHLNTLFRNHFYGDVYNNPAKSSNTAVINIASYGRYFNVIGNVLGRTGYYNNYESNLDESSKSIFALGWSPEIGTVPDDPQTKATLMRWGNYDTVNNAVRFNASEVPTSLSTLSNPLPSSQNLPASMYLSSKPGWWPSSTPWPPIGPDVNGGNVSGYGGHANKIPARVCYETTSKTNNILNFSPAACYGAGSGPGPGPISCDVNGDGSTNVVDVQRSVNEVLGLAACTSDINADSICNVVDVQLVVNAALGGPCGSP